ncbi:hypothetical protein B6A10_05345 [Flavobacterium sp. L1I52]|uniref:Uncharacterized protein n=1 Tax=Flavobacterium pokkalii TaxID=1940408 RepID=A0ABR7UQD9_9FLAO|nr:hypothetical protein [Flavobacterium pokkalii]MBD0724597.1 hypothetical protein [Flavobacterium pokkalii]
MREIIKFFPVTTILLTYLFVCGSLYLIGFWSIFNIDAFSLISLYDIPKNFVYPLMISQGTYFINMLLGQSLHQLSFINQENNTENFIKINENWSPKKKKIIIFLTLKDLWPIIIIFSLPLIISNHEKNILYWSISSLILSYFLLYKFVNFSSVKLYIPNIYIRFYLGHFLTFFPISCFSVGKIESLKIYHNKKEIRYFDIISKDNKTQINDPKCLKFIGFISDKVIYSTLDNQKTFILNKDSSDGFQLSNN